MTDKPSVNDVLAKAKALRRQMDKTARDAKKAYERSPVGQAQEAVTAWARFLSRTVQTGQWLYENVFSPVGHVLDPIAGWAWRGYKKLWNKVTNVKDKYGDEQFSKKRAGIMVIGTAVAALYTPEVVTETVSTALHGAFMAATYERHKVILLNPQEIEPKEDLWSVTGCEKLPCSDENSIYYRVRPNFLHHVWSLAVNKNLFFSDNVAGSIPPVPSECDIEDYSVRWKLVVRNAQIYPYIMKVHTCVPIAADAITTINAPKPSAPGHK